MNNEDSHKRRLEILSNNPGVNPDTVAAHLRLEQQLMGLGVGIKPKFNLEPPLGRRGRIGLHHRTR